MPAGSLKRVLFGREYQALPMGLSVEIGGMASWGTTYAEVGAYLVGVVGVDTCVVGVAGVGVWSGGLEYASNLSFSRFTESVIAVDVNTPILGLSKGYPSTNLPLTYLLTGKLPRSSADAIDPINSISFLSPCQ